MAAGFECGKACRFRAAGQMAISTAAGGLRLAGETRAAVDSGGGAEFATECGFYEAGIGSSRVSCEASEEDEEYGEGLYS